MAQKPAISYWLSITTVEKVKKPDSGVTGAGVSLPVSGSCPIRASIQERKEKKWIRNLKSIAGK
jgi:hypothetical protein